jgi:hypothetical protein
MKILYIIFCFCFFNGPCAPEEKKEPLRRHNGPNGNYINY